MKEEILQRINEIKDRLSKARKGPWKSYVEGRDHQSGSSFIMVGEGDLRGDDIYLTDATEADQDFIANARQDIPFLLELIESIKNKNN